MEKGYKTLKIYELLHKLAIMVHKMTLSLPKLELFKEGSQCRRSSKSVSSNIVEGYALRKYKNEYLHYLYRSYGSSLETIEHLEFLHETGSLSDEKIFTALMNGYDELNKMLFGFIKSIERQHKTPYFVKEEGLGYNY